MLTLLSCVHDSSPISRLELVEHSVAGKAECFSPDQKYSPTLDRNLQQSGPVLRIKMQVFVLTNLPRTACFGHNVFLLESAPNRHPWPCCWRATFRLVGHRDEQDLTIELVTSEGWFLHVSVATGFMLTSCDMAKRKTPCLQRLAWHLLISTILYRHALHWSIKRNEVQIVRAPEDQYYLQGCLTRRHAQSIETLSHYSMFCYRSQTSAKVATRCPRMFRFCDALQHENDKH